VDEGVLGQVICRLRVHEPGAEAPDLIVRAFHELVEGALVPLARRDGETGQRIHARHSKDNA